MDVTDVKGHQQMRGEKFLLKDKHVELVEVGV